MSHLLAVMAVNSVRAHRSEVEPPPWCGLLTPPPWRLRVVGRHCLVVIGNQWLGPGHGVAVFLLLFFRLGRVGPGAGCRLTVGGGVDTTMLACLVFVVVFPLPFLSFGRPLGAVAFRWRLA